MDGFNFSLTLVVLVVDVRGWYLMYISVCLFIESMELYLWVLSMFFICVECSVKTR